MLFKKDSGNYIVKVYNIILIRLFSNFAKRFDKNDTSVLNNS